MALCTVTRGAVVLGSTQPPPPAGALGGWELARRRSGGGAVLVQPGDPVWVDVAVPAGDPLWCADVSRAFWWLGDTWARALASLQVDRAVVHRGPLVRTRWSAAVCFAGLGPGEVTVGGRKVVGLAQRRTRAGALFHCAVPLGWQPELLLALLGVEREEREAGAAALREAVRPLHDLAVADVEAAFLAALPPAPMVDGWGRGA